MNAAAAATQLCAGAAQRRRKVDPRRARLLRLAVVTRALRLVRDQLLACSSGGGGQGRYRRIGPPVHGGGAAPSPVARDDGEGVADGEDVVSLKVSLLGDCHIGKTSFMVINSSCRPPLLFVIP
jgi:Rab family, other